MADVTKLPNEGGEIVAAGSITGLFAYFVFFATFLYLIAFVGMLLTHVRR